MAEKIAKPVSYRTKPAVPILLLDDYATSKETKATREAVEKIFTVDGEKLIQPRYLSPDAKREWTRVVSLYSKIDAKLLSSLDQVALTVYCEAVAVYKKAHKIWRHFAAKIEKEYNSDYVASFSKAIDIMNKQAAIITKLGEGLCLNPVGRARLGVAMTKNPKQEAEENPLSAMFSKD